MLALLLISMFLLVLLGMDIVFVLYTSCILVITVSHVVGDFPIAFEVIAQYSYGGVDTFSFTAIPLFILAGEIMNRGGITDRLVEFSSKIVGHIHGGIAQVGVALNMVMAGSSGSAVADCAATGSVLIPSMKKEGYSPEKSAAIIATASTVGPIIPPSIPMIIIGGMAGISIGKLFIAGIIPGIMMGVSIMIYLYFYAKRKKMKPYPRAPFREQLQATKFAILPLGMPFLIIGTIMTGVVSPTESAVIGVLYVELFIGPLI